MAQYNKAAVAQLVRHMDHFGGSYDRWYVGIEEEGPARYKSKGSHPIRFKLKSADEAKQTMSHLLDMGLMADDEYDTEPTLLFVYLEK